MISKTTLTELREKLIEIQQAQDECISELGYVITSCREKYNILTKHAKELREAIIFLEKLESHNQN